MKKKKYVKPRTDIVEVLVENNVLGVVVGSGGTDTAFSKKHNSMSWDDWEDDNDNDNAWWKNDKENGGANHGNVDIW